MTRSPSPSIASRRRVAAAVSGVILALGVSTGVQPVVAQEASHGPVASAQVAPASATQGPTSAIVPALPPTDPRYILARLESEYLIEIAKAWYPVEDETTERGMASSTAP